MANTLKFGNGNWATKAGSTLAYNDESGFNPLPFDFTRASSATVVNKNGLIETVASGIPRIDFLGNTKGALLLEPSRTNLITQSEAFGNSYWLKSGASIQGDPSTAGVEKVVNGDFATDSNWTKGSGWTISGGTANYDGVASIGDIQQSESLVLGKTYKYSFTISNRTQGGVRFFVGNTVGLTHSANGTFTGYITYSSGGYILLQARDSFIGSIDNVSIKEVQGFASPSADSPLGAYLLVPNTNNSLHFIQSNNVGNLSGSGYNMSFFVKPNGYNFVRVFNQIIGIGVDIDIVNEVVSNKNNEIGNVTIKQYGDWKRIQVEYIGSRTFSYLAIQPMPSALSGATFVGDGTSGVYIYGAQIEAGSYATSIINTSGSAVTRQADVCISGANSEVINSTEGVLYVEISALANDGTYRGLCLSNGSASNRVLIYLNNGSNQLRANVVAQGNLQANLIYTVSDVTILNKVAIRWSLNNVSFWINGSKVLQDLDAPLMPTGLNELSFDSNGVGGEKFYGNTKDVRVYNTALTDAELQALTTI